MVEMGERSSRKWENKSMKSPEEGCSEGCEGCHCEEAEPIPVKVNGDVKGTIVIPPNAEEADIIEALRLDDDLSKYMDPHKLRRMSWNVGHSLELFVKE